MLCSVHFMRSSPFKLRYTPRPLSRQVLNFLSRIRQNTPFNSLCQWAHDVERVQCQCLEVHPQSISKRIETAGNTRYVLKSSQIINTVRTGIIEDLARNVGVASPGKGVAGELLSSKRKSLAYLNLVPPSVLYVTTRRMGGGCLFVSVLPLNISFFFLHYPSPIIVPPSSSNFYRLTIIFLSFLTDIIIITITSTKNTSFISRIF